MCFLFYHTFNVKTLHCPVALDCTKKQRTEQYGALFFSSPFVRVFSHREKRLQNLYFLEDCIYQITIYQCYSERGYFYENGKPITISCGMCYNSRVNIFPIFKTTFEGNQLSHAI